MNKLATGGNIYTHTHHGNDFKFENSLKFHKNDKQMKLRTIRHL